MSDTLLEQTLKVGGLEALAFLLLHELSHIIKSHLRKNLLQLHPYGDLKRQLFLFNNQYTGFDALFIDHFTNTRYTLDQEVEADLLAIRLMQEIGLIQDSNFTEEVYKDILKAIQ